MFRNIKEIWRELKLFLSGRQPELEASGLKRQMLPFNLSSFWLRRRFYAGLSCSLSSATQADLLQARSHVFLRLGRWQKWSFHLHLNKLAVFSVAPDFLYASNKCKHF